MMLFLLGTAFGILLSAFSVYYFVSESRKRAVGKYWWNMNN